MVNELGPISLLTDFGYEDTYVGQMKGVILGINPAARIVDVSHSVSRHDVVTGAMMLREAWSHFPAGTVHVAVVDPGVGGERRALAVEAGGHVFIGPDNGLLMPAVQAASDEPRFLALTNPEYFREPVSTTFHGRDLFAPVAAHLTAGVSLDEIGDEIDDPVDTPVLAPWDEGGLLVAEVLRIDHFGNLVTNVRREHLAASEVESVSAQIRGLRASGIYSSYQSVEPGELLVLWGSGGFLEIAAREASAAEVIGAGIGTSVVIMASAKDA